MGNAETRAEKKTTIFIDSDLPFLRILVTKCRLPLVFILATLRCV